MSNFPAMEPLLAGNPRFAHTYIGPDTGVADCLRWAWRSRSEADFLILNIDHRRLLVTCALYWLFAPRGLRRCKLVSVDILLRPAFSFKAKCVAWVKRALLKQVDTFILYFKDIDGYVGHYGLPRERSVYVPFKVNSWEKLRARREEVDEGEYVLLAGATLRDHSTFIEAVKRSKVPALLLIPGGDRASIEQAEWYRSGLPENLKVEFHTDGREETYLGYFEKARVLCLPRFGWDIASSGISAYLCAMGLGKCVVISKGPGAEDVLSDGEAAVFFEPGNVEGLARALAKVWVDDVYRRRIALNGTRYAESLEGEPRLLNDILKSLDAPARC